MWKIALYIFMCVFSVSANAQMIEKNGSDSKLYHYREVSGTGTESDPFLLHSLTVSSSGTEIIDSSPLEISKGNVDGHRVVQVAGRNGDIGTSFEDISDLGGTLIYPTSGEQWEILSSSGGDNAAGSGMRTVSVTYLDDSYVQQTETKILDGTSPVTFIASNSFRFISARGLTWGATTENQGVITVRVSGGASPADNRGGIDFDASVIGDEMGLNASNDLHYTVPAGETAFPQYLYTNTTKNHDITVRALVRLFGEDGWLLVGELGNYQNTFTEDFSIGSSGLAEKTDVRIVARSDNASVPVNGGLIMILVENAEINPLAASSSF